MSVHVLSKCDEYGYVTIIGVYLRKSRAQKAHARLRDLLVQKLMDSKLNEEQPDGEEYPLLQEYKVIF